MNLKKFRKNIDQRSAPLLDVSSLLFLWPSNSAAFGKFKKKSTFAFFKNTHENKIVFQKYFNV